MQPDPQPDAPTFSVVIPTYNEERFIRRCLESVRAQHYAPDRIEIIVVDNGSTDNTVAIGREYADILLHHPGIRVGAMRNRGAQAASGQLLAFLDADCLAEPDWLANAAQALARERCVTGDSYDIPRNPHWIERAWFAQEHRGRRATHLLPAGNLIVPRDAFLHVGGFNEALVTGEDAEFCQRVSQLLAVIADDRIRVIHLGNPRTLKKFLLREMWHGMGALGSLKLNWKDKPLFGTILVALLTIAQVVGLVLLASGSGGQLLLFSTLGLLALLAATVGYRVRAIRDWGAVPALFLLYYVYYLGRAISLLLMLVRREFRRREK